MMAFTVPELLRILREESLAEIAESAEKLLRFLRILRENFSLTLYSCLQF